MTGIPWRRERNQTFCAVVDFAAAVAAVVVAELLQPAFEHVGATWRAWEDQQVEV